MKVRFLAIALILCMSLSLLCGCEGNFDVRTPVVSYDVDTTITMRGSSVDIAGSGAGLEDGDVVISAGGIYLLTGTLTDSRIMVKADEDETVTLILAGVDITNPNDEGIYIKTAASAEIILADSTTNTVTSGAEHVAQETVSETDTEATSETSTDEDASGAAIRAKCPLTISGQGSVTIYGYINNGLAVNGDLLIESGTFDITAVNDTLKSKANLTITGGSFTLSSDMDAIQAEGTLDISGGDFIIHTGAGSEGAEVKVSDSSMMGDMGSRDQHSGSSEASSEASSTDADASEEASASEEITAIDTDTAETDSSPAEAAEKDTAAADAAEPDDGASEEISADASREMFESASGEMFGMFGDWDSDDADTGSQKGLKATEAIIVSGGTFLLDTEDDAIHSDGTVTISGGEIVILAGDDGVHGDASLDISGGTVDIQTCYEGLEAQSILISDGIITIIASDDGMNANGGGGMMGGMMGGMRGSRSSSDEASDEADADETEDSSSEIADTTEQTDAAQDEADASSAEIDDTASDEADTTASDEISEETTAEETSPVLRITGGYITVDSGGDGLDSNGSIYIEGGTTYVSGPASAWDAAVDVGEGTSEFKITGGVLMTGGYSAMAESPDSGDDTQPSIYYSSEDYAEDNAVVTLADTDGNVIAQYTFAHSFNCVIISTPDILVGETYTLTMGDVSTEIEMTTASYSNRSMGASGGMGFGGR